MEADQPPFGGSVRAPLWGSAGHLLHPAQAPSDHNVTRHAADVQTCRNHKGLSRTCGMKHAFTLCLGRESTLQTLTKVQH